VARLGVENEENDHDENPLDNDGERLRDHGAW
jgi:hypothetical protein